MTRRWIWLAAALAALAAVTAGILQAIARPVPVTHDEQLLTGRHKRLVVMVHGLAGRDSFSPAVQTAQAELPGSDFLVFSYDARPLSNASPYAIAHKMEHDIHAANMRHGYEEVVLIGHSMGGALLRKVLLWANGLEADRVSRSGVRPWASKVSRFVSLAGINRGWSIDPAPEHMRWGRWLGMAAGQRLARWSGTGGLLLSLQRGAPFVADSRVQWIDLSRGNAPAGARAPLAIHLLGDRDDIVSRRDAADFGVAKDTVFVTLADTGHADIAAALQGDDTAAGRERRRKVAAALRGDLAVLEPDRDQALAEDTSVTRLVYVMHGIRDYGEWGGPLRDAIEREAQATGEKVAVVSAMYGHFPMLPFLLYWDRQKNVRWFMDEHTQNKARYPRLRKVDFVGHSNGSYILASALQKYRSLAVERVYFAGSVVPKHYPWRELIDAQRVAQVANVVAAGDWVVALFPRFFEQVAEWLGQRPVDGFLDIGSAGFRGFQAAQDAARRVVNYQFTPGGHGTGVDTQDSGKLQAIARFIATGDTGGMVVFQARPEPDGTLAVLSNISWVVWVLLALLLGGLGWLLFRRGRRLGAAYVAVVLALVYSV